jgi:hypothetical protein
MSIAKGNMVIRSKERLEIPIDLKGKLNGLN